MRHRPDPRVDPILGAGMYKCVERHGDRVEIVLDGWFNLSFAHIEALAAEFGTKNINIEGNTGEPDLSDVTPGSSGSCCIVLRGVTK